MRENLKFYIALLVEREVMSLAKKWKYSLVVESLDPGDIIVALERAGEEGLELVCVQTWGDKVLLYFKQ